MKKVWNIQTSFDSRSRWTDSREVILGPRSRKTCRTTIGDGFFCCATPPRPDGAMEDRKNATSCLRMERILSLRAAIASGRYRVSSADLAQKLMSHMPMELQ